MSANKRPSRDAEEGRPIDDEVGCAVEDASARAPALAVNSDISQEYDDKPPDESSPPPAKRAPPSREDAPAAKRNASAAAEHVGSVGRCVEL